MEAGKGAAIRDRKGSKGAKRVEEACLRLKWTGMAVWQARESKGFLCSGELGPCRRETDGI